MITIYSVESPPNGWKIVIVCEELGIPYELKFLDFSANEHKGAEFLKVNPNGRIPALVDHDNGDFAIWESGAIVQYLADRYDKENKLSFPIGTNEWYLVQQWIAFQISGQGPYYGQVGWFRFRHPEKIPSAVERYQKEIERVTSVLDASLEGKKYLVGDKLTVADLIFIPWNWAAQNFLLPDSGIDLSKYKNYTRWNTEMLERPGVKKAYELRDKALAAMKK